MKNSILMFVRDSKKTNEHMIAILDSLSPGEREKKRGSYYGSLSGLARHIFGGNIFFLGMFREYFPDKIKDFAPDNNLMDHTSTLGDNDWLILKASLAQTDQMLIDFVGGLNEKDLEKALALNWYGGNPAEVPLHFLLNQLIAHGIHHRGQVSQILDEQNIDNDYSGIDVAFLPGKTR